MCNLYNITTTTEALRQFTKALRDLGGWNQPTLDIFPNVRAPVVRVAKDGQREITMLQWGMPTPPERVKGNYDPGTTNIRQPSYFHWRQWMGVENRCIVPATSFAEPSPRKDTNGKTPNVWFALGDDEPLFAFPGIWTRWQGVRRVRDGPGDFELFGIFTTRPNAVVAPIHDKAMPVILRSEEEIDTWLSAPADEALKLQRPLPDETLKIVAITEKERNSPAVSFETGAQPPQLSSL